MSPELCPEKQAPGQTWGLAGSGCSLLIHQSPNLFCSKKSGAYTRALRAQNPHAPLKAPGCPRLWESDLGAPRVPSGKLSRALAHPAVSVSSPEPGCPHRTSFQRTLSHSQTLGPEDRHHRPCPLSYPLGREEVLPERRTVAPRAQSTVPAGSLGADPSNHTPWFEGWDRPPRGRDPRSSSYAFGASGPQLLTRRSPSSQGTLSLAWQRSRS